MLNNSTNFPIFTIELNDSLVRNYIDLLKQKREVVTVKLTVNNDVDSPETKLISPEELIRFREVTGKYTYDPAEDLRARWNLPLDVEIGRYTGYNIIVFTLFSRTDEKYTLTAKADDAHLEIMTFDESGMPVY